MRVVHPRIPRLSSIAIGIAMLLAVGVPLRAQAAIYTVTNTDASGDGSLAQAIDDANGSTGPDEIVFQSGVSGTIVPDNTLVISDELTITGPGADVVEVNGGNVRRVFEVDAKAKITGLSIQNGNAASGGGVFNQSELTIDFCEIGNNRAGNGGGVYNNGGIVIIGHSLFFQNLATSNGGGLYTTDPSATIKNTTFSANSASFGDAIYHDVGLTTISHCTITSNTGVFAVVVNDGAMNVNNTIIAGNVSDTFAQGSGSLNDDGSNFIGGDPMLGPLLDNGGPTRTHRPSSGSPVINNVNGNCAGLTDDQRGFPRPAGPRCDIGSVEVRYPVADAGRDTVVCAGGSVRIGGSPTASGGESSNYAYSWTPTAGLDNPSSSNPVASPAASTTYTVLVTDQSTGLQDSDDVRVTIGDTTPPEIQSCAPPQSATAGSNGTAPVPDFTATTSATDNCGGITKSQSPTAGTPLGPGSYTVTITVLDDSNNPATCTTTFTVNPNGGGCTDHDAPSVTGVSASPSALWPPDHKLKRVAINYTVTDASTVTCTLSVTSSDPVTGVGDGDTSPDWVVVDPHTVQLRAERSNGNKQRTYTVTITCVDACGNRTVKTVKVVVAHNVESPVCGNLSKLGSTCSFRGAFWDVAGRRHTSQWTFDGLSATGTVVEPSGSINGSSSASYKFAATGVYKVQMNLTDDKNVTSYANTNNDVASLVVVYDPASGYVTGGGWFNSAAGALKSKPSATGKASFGFVSRYYASSMNPKGEAQFELKVGGFEFHADGFDKLTVTGPKAQYKGSGKVTGDVSSYGFALTVNDGQVSSGGGVDRIRLKIWKKSNNAVVYDNQSGASDGANPTTAVGSGSSIVIVSSAALASASQANTPPAGEMDAMRAIEFGVEQNVPNPVLSTAVVHYSLPVECDVQMKVYDVGGREVGSMVDGIETAGLKTAELDATKLSGGVYFYRLEARSLDGVQRFAKTRKMLVVR
jgi:predicted outer membrane repeat protein